MAELTDLPQSNAYFRELMTGLHGRYPLPPKTSDHPELGQHVADFEVDDTTLYQLAESAIHC